MKSAPGQGVKNPVYEDYDVKGVKRWERVSFFQENATRMWVIEPLNLATKKGKMARIWAGYIGQMFSELRAADNIRGKPVNTTAVVSVHPEDRQDKDIDYALSVLRDNGEVVDWVNPASRQQFIDERERVALHM